MALREYLQPKKRKRDNHEELSTTEDLLREILENLKFANRLSILQVQFLLMEINPASSDAERSHRRQLTETVKKVLNEYTTEEG